MVDSGVTPHPDLAPNVAEGVALVDCEGDCEAPWHDDAGHGWARAGIVGATGEGDAALGVAPAVTLLPVKVLDATNTGRVSLVVEGLRWAVSRDCEVANPSISGAASRAFDDAVGLAASRETVVVASAGNVGSRENCVNPLAAHPEVAAVTATTRDDGLAPFSVTDPEAELAATGVTVHTTGSEGYVTLDGTSFSAPHVARAAALCRASGRSATTTRELLVGTAAPLDLDAPEAGNGLVDAESSVVQAVRTRDPPIDGRTVALRGALPRLEADRADVWFSFRWRPRRRWRETSLQRRTESGEFDTTVRLCRGLAYLVRAHARFPDGRRVVGRRVRFRVPVRGRADARRPIRRR